MNTIVLFHGLCGSSLELNFLANSLRRAGFQVELPNIEGYTFGTGISDWRDWVAQAGNIVNKITNNFEQGVVIGGLSMGATLALAIASKRNDIAGVVALSTMLRYDGWAIPWYRPLLPLGHAIGFGRIYEYKEREPFGVKNIQLRAYVKKALEQNRVSEIGGESFSLHHLVEGDRLMTYVKNNLSKVIADLLTIHAIDDEVASIRNAEMVLKKTSSKIKESIFLGNSYHIITVDNERETVFNSVESFLREIANRNLDDEKSQIPILSQEYARFIRDNKN